MKITRIPGKTIPQIIVRKKVAAYCRVSTQQEIQHHSLDAQRQYYESLILNQPGWMFAGIYADQASGRNNARMQAFQQMMDDCRNGKIDLILVKSISRMGRNTVQFLKACDELKQLGVEVFFEVEWLYINNPKAVQLLTIHASMCQNESESKSYAVTWGIRTRFADGSSGFANRPCFVYRKSDDGNLFPIPEEAETVRCIFEWHRQGMSLRKDASMLEEMDIKSPRGNSRWSIETIRKILNNEKYSGDVIMQKTYVENYFMGNQAKNHGILPQYLLKANHKPII